MTIKIQYDYPLYTDHVRPVGFLEIDKRFHACFHYYVLCQKLLEKAGKSIEDQIVYDDSRWMDKPYGNIASGTAIRYGLADPGEFLKPRIKRAVELEVARMGWPSPDDEYWNVSPGKVVYS